jgi:cellobiose phosphorylase
VQGKGESVWLGHFLFGLLTDFIDAPYQTLPGDEELMNVAEQKILALNKKYHRVKNNLFFLFHVCQCNPYWNIRKLVQRLIN